MSENLKAQKGSFDAKSHYVNNRLFSLVLVAGLTIFSTAVHAKDKKPKVTPAAPKDEIEVVGHIPSTDGPVRRFFSTQHYSSYYLYAERDAGKNVTLIDVTKTGRPSVLADVAYPSSSGSDSLTLVAGTAALVTSDAAAPSPAAAPQTVRIMDFSDPRNPKVAREFTGVTAMSRDDGRGLIFVANPEGIWILQRHFALDPEVEKEYANYVLYSH
jgi:hypothetical protein